MSVLSRIWNRLYTTCAVPIKEKVFHNNGVDLKYVFFRKRSDVLVIGFQACNPAGARYNYFSTLRGFPVNRLYIKDDFAENHRGSYYLGCKGQDNVESAVIALIQTYIKLTNAKKLIFIGSSKGAYAGINFGIQFPDSIMIVGAPQYYLGNYLNSETHLPSLKDIVGDEITEAKIEKLNNRLKEKILSDPDAHTQKIFLHYSDREHTYKEHIEDLIEDLKQAEFSLDFDKKEYSMHEDLKLYYPDYLKRSLRSII